MMPKVLCPGASARIVVDAIRRHKDPGQLAGRDRGFMMQRVTISLAVQRPCPRT
jgi:hypothetical protein